jgi:solute:Na+ symporter, SSS family
VSDYGYLALLLAYSIVLICLGLALSRHVKTSSAFFVAGRALPAPLLFTTVLAANIGAGSTVGAAGIGYAQGLSAWWWVGSAGLGSLLLAFVIGPKIYALARRHEYYTVGDFLEHRYGRAVKLAFAAVLWLGSLAILAGQLIAMAWILNVVAGIPKPFGVLLGGVVVTAYFTAGGLFSAAWINVLQLAVKLAGFVLAAPWAVYALGGWDAVRSAAASHLSVSGGSAPSSPDAYFGMTGIGLEGILGYAVILIPSFFISPGLIQKLYGARDVTVIRRAIGLQAVVLLLYAFLPAILGIAAFAAFPGLSNRELALPMVLKQLLPGWLGALLLAAVFSAEVSTADAILFMLSTSVSKDFYRTLWKPRANDAELLRAGRWAAVAGGAAGAAAAVFLPTVITALTIFYGLLTVVLLVPLVAGLYSKTPRSGAAMACILASLGSAAVAHLATGGKGWWVFTPFAIGTAAGALVMLAAAFGRSGLTGSREEKANH